MEKIIRDKLFDIDDRLSSILHEIIDRDFNTKDTYIKYELTSIEITAKRIKDKLYNR